MFSKIRQLLGQLSLLFLLCLYHGVKKTKKKKGLPLLPSHSAGKERQGNVRQQPLPSPLHRQEIKPALQGPPKGFDPSPVPFPYLSHFFLWQKWASHSPHSWDRKKLILSMLLRGFGSGPLSCPGFKNRQANSLPPYKQKNPHSHTNQGT